MKKFSDITTRDGLAEFLGITKKMLTYVLYVKKVDSYYKEFELPKKSGGARKINAPHDELKTIQLKLYLALKNHKNIERKSKNNISHAFENKKGIITNAAIHRNKRYVLNLDLKDFFNSFHFGRVCGYFEKNKNFNLPHDIAVVLAQLLCYKGSLPQGAPTSPIMTNLICEIFDMQLLKLSKKYKLDYTRYADDLTFSTNNKNFLEVYDEFIKQISGQIAHAGFLINDKKTRLQFKDSQQKVTGLIVNKKIQVDKPYYKTTRAMADKLYKTGEFYIDEQLGSLNQLEGRFTFIDQLSKYNNKISGVAPKNNNLCGREKEYRKFLFYKYFYANKKPLLVTEGKTDILYLKAALKKMYADYPELVSRNENGDFNFEISFLNRTKRLAHFFNCSITGADAMNSLYKFYYEKPN
ncbi:MAG: retron Ec67 family RNA-directed DNA polymerase/endonuclease, partial [Clostridia bacterium]|nr:retron Ec67 family RNA-directed DNA polymerase/endonuclease [Clostridia bacterium]